jgi:hypothetical protein
MKGMERLLRVQATVPATGIFVFLLVFGMFGGVGDPSTPARWVGAGVLLAPAFMVYAHRRAAACAALFAALVWSALASSVAAAVLVWAYAGTTVLIARLDRAAKEEPVTLRLPPVPEALPRVGGPVEAAGGLLLLVAVLGGVGVRADVGAAPWLTPLIVAAGCGCALIARAVQGQRALRDLFHHAQPAYEVRVVEQLGYVHVLLPAPDGQTAREFGFDVAETDEPPDEDEPHTLPAVLYGDPRPGKWCAVEVTGGRLHVPLGPIGEVITVRYDVVQGLPREIEDDQEQLVDPDVLLEADRAVAAFEPREHRISPPRAWAATAAIGLGAALAAGELARIAGAGRPGMVLLVAVAAAAGYEYGWRTQLRPLLRWHAGGVASVGFRGFDRQPWATDSAVVHDDEGSVVLTCGESVLTVPVPPPWPRAAAQRSAEQLVAALREARTRSLEISPLEPPPRIEIPARPLALYPAFFFSILIALVILS